MGPLVFPQLLSPRNIGGCNLEAAGLEMEKNAAVGRGRQGLSPPATTTAKAPNS